MKEYAQLKNDVLAVVLQAAEINNISVSTLFNDILDKIEFDVSNKTSSYKGIANTTTNPGVPTGYVFYIATTSGAYAYFLDHTNTPITLNGALNILSYNGNYWSATSFSVDLSSYTPLTDFNRAFNYPFSDASNIFLQADLKKIVINAQLITTNYTKTYYIKLFKYHTSGNNLNIEIWDVETPQLVASYNNANYVPTSKFEIIDIATQNGSELSAKLLLNTSELVANLNLTNISYLFSQFSIKTFALFSDTFLSLFAKMKGTLNKDFKFTDNGLQLYDDSGKMSLIPNGAYLAGKASFVGTNTSVIVPVTGATANDVFVATIGQRNFNASDILSVDAGANQITVYRLSGGYSGLTFNWMRIGK